MDERRRVKKLKMTTTTEQTERLTTSISATQPLASPGRQVRVVMHLVMIADKQTSWKPDKQTNWKTDKQKS